MTEDEFERAPSARKPLSAEDQDQGQRLRQLRVRSGISQRELAARVGMTSQGISKLEAGAIRLSATRLARIAAALNVPPSDLLAGPEPELSTADRQTMRLLRLFRNLNATQRASILALLYALQPSNDS